MSPAAIDVLLIEDEPLDARLVQRTLRAEVGNRMRLHHAPTLGAGLERLEAGGIGVVLLDLNVPDSEGVQTVTRLRARDASVPVVVFTAAEDDETALAALGAGAQDYLVKDEIGGAVLHRSILHAIERQRMASENARLARLLNRAEKLESLGALCGGIGFGITEPLGTIFDQCGKALSRIGSPGCEQVLRNAFLEIHRAAFRIAEMGQHLRDYSALELSTGDDVEDVELTRFVIEAQDFLASIVSREIDVVCEQASGPLLVAVARAELHRMLVSLVVNAAEAIGGRRASISIATGSLEVDAELLSSAHGAADAEPGLHAFLRVSDSGRGLGAVRRERVFDPFYTTKRAGRGLGLASVVGIVRRRRGAVCVEPNHPSGAVFTILLPLRRPS